MSLIVLEGVSLSFGKQRIVDRLDLRIGDRERIGLIGPNGSGKSSLLGLLAGQIQPDAGSVRGSKGLRIGVLPQEIPAPADRTVSESVYGAVPGRDALVAELQGAEQELATATADGDEAAMMEAATTLSEAHEALAHFEEHFAEHEAHRILAGLGFGPDDFDRPLRELSGGWRMRARLAQILFQRPGLLLLDEPTNHLDMPTVAWFSEFLAAYPHTFMLICHDREFLNEQIGRVVSFELEGVRQYRGDYEQYVRQRAEEREVLENQTRNLQRERAKAQQFIDRFRAQANKAKAVQSRIKALERMDELPTLAHAETMQIRFPPSARCGAQPVAVHNLSKGYGDLRVLEGVEVQVSRGDKVGIIGVNGAGKTTLLRTMAGELTPDSGEVEVGHGAKVGYYAQHHADALDLSQTIFEAVAIREPGASETKVRTLLGALLFRGDDIDKPIRVLSGGERARVALARLLIDPGNVLLMDEPTNHLDLSSSEMLAEALSNYDGTLVFVSHNRAFVRRLATKIWDVADGRVETYPGSLDDYLARHRYRADGDPASPAAADEPKAKSGASPTRDATPATLRARRDNRKASRKEAARRRQEHAKRFGPLKKRLATLETQIESVETAQRERNLQLADPALYDDAKRRQQVLTAHRAASDELAELTDAWEAVQAELDALEQDSSGAK